MICFPLALSTFRKLKMQPDKSVCVQYVSTVKVRMSMHKCQHFDEPQALEQT